MEEHDQATGSEKLLSELGIGTMRDKHLGELLDLFKREKIALDRWMIYGQPPRFIDRVVGSAQIERGALGRVMESLLGSEHLALTRFKGFPLGKPAIDRITVEFELAGRVR